MAKKRGKIKNQHASGSRNIKGPSDEEHNTNKLKPHVSFEFIEKGSDIISCERQDQASLACQLQQIGSRTWSELIAAPRQGLGYEMIKEEHIQGLNDSIRQEHKKLMVFRFGGKQRLIGFRVSRTYCIVQVDPNHAAYDS